MEAGEGHFFALRETTAATCRSFLAPQPNAFSPDKVTPLAACFSVSLSKKEPERKLSAAPKHLLGGLTTPAPITTPKRRPVIALHIWTAATRRSFLARQPNAFSPDKVTPLAARFSVSLSQKELGRKLSAAQNTSSVDYPHQP
ncbi:hypothetical protein Q31a_51620 [Aureliella helgolandensis]|uniref:Uncharacterized protein n=1 Tax=Aureliella helgolandensis TaxID=2527968 RepID=A0A518GDW1_9BACT|nr:hypothetical protein Q31a_51620 [Aureliella helgolandensis]